MRHRTTPWIMAMMLAPGLPACSGPPAMPVAGDPGRVAVRHLDCPGITAETARVQALAEHIGMDSGFAGRGLLSMMGELGTGSSAERKEALQATGRRLAALEAARRARNSQAG